MKIVAIDLDGTLLHSDCTISQFSRDMITKACNEDIMVVPTSGRSFRSIKNQVEDIEGIQNCISVNGSILTDLHSEKILYNHKLDDHIAYKVYKEVKEQGGFIELYCDNESYFEKGNDSILYDTELSRDFCDNLLSTAIPVLSVDLLLRRGIMKVNKFHIAFSDVNKVKAFAEQCSKWQDVNVTFPTEYNMEIFAKDCNKDMGIRLLSEKYDIAHEDTVAIGDSDNDVAMIEYANVGIAVDNAIDALKEAADYITKSNNEDGPAIVLEKILKK